MTTQPDFREVGEDFLEHYGKMGMHWGVRRNSETGVRPIAKTLNDSKFGKASNANAEKHMARQAAKPKKVKITSSDIHQARARQSIRERKYEESQGDFMVARTNKGKDQAEKVMRKLEKDYFLGKDAKTANRMTRGEKIGTTIMLGAAGLIFAGTIAQASRDAQAGRR